MRESYEDTIPPVPPLASIEALGRHLAALHRAYDHVDNTSDAASRAGDEAAVKRAETARASLSHRMDALESLITLAQAETLADAAVQIHTAVLHVPSLIYKNKEELDEYIGAIERALLSALPIVTVAAALDPEEMGFRDALDRGALWFGGVRPPSTAHPDAALIADCAAFDALERDYIAAVDQGAERKRIVALQEPIVTRIVETRAITPEGQRARARSLILWAPDLVKEGAGNTDQRLIHALLRDLLGETAPPSDPDAGLFRLVAEFETAHEAYWAAEEGDSAARDAAAAARTEAGKALAAAKPATPAGHAARAAAALRCSGGFVPDNPAEGLQYLPQGLVLAVLRDLAGAVA